jgi:hypothetical protein
MTFVRNINIQKLVNDVLKQLSALLLIVCMLIFNSCKKDSFCNCLKSTGGTVTEVRYLTEFNKLEIKKNVKVFIVQDSVSIAKVTCGKHLMDGVSTEVIDGKLTITNKNRCNWSRSFQNEFIVELHCPNLVDIRYSTSGDLVMLNRFKVDSLFIESGLGSGSIVLDLDVRALYAVLNTSVADLTIKGKVDLSYLFANAQGFIDAREVENSYTYMRTNATNDCKVKVNDHLDAEIEAEGNIYYYGSPGTVNLKKTGTGNLIKAD